MTTSTATNRPTPSRPHPYPGATAAVLALTAVLALAALLGPSLVTNDLGMTMSRGITHYRELLAVNQPRNPILFMAIPVVIAETLAITELAILYLRDATRCGYAPPAASPAC